MTTGSPPAARPSPRWLGTVLYLPLLMAIGWVLSRPLDLLAAPLRADQVNLVGTVIAFLLLLITLPARLRRVWAEPRPWLRLGVSATGRAMAMALLRGLLMAALLLGLVSAVMLVSDQARPNVTLTGPHIANALALMLGVGFAEELIFRGWLWGELQLQLNGRQAFVAQALVFALVHARFDLAPMPLLALLGGLLLLGLLLAAARLSEGGVIWSAVGLHGGLVGGWFALQSGLLTIDPSAPARMVGPGGTHPNPIGGWIGWLGLGCLLIAQRTAVARALRPSTGARRASFSGETP